MKKNVMSGPSIDSIFNEEIVEVLDIVTEEPEPIPMSRYDFSKAYRKNLELQGIYTEQEINIRVAKKIKAISTPIKDTSKSTVFAADTLEQKLSKFQINAR